MRLYTYGAWRGHPQKPAQERWRTLSENQGETASAAALLSDAAKKTLDYQTMKFDLVYEKGSTKVSGAKISEAAGEIERPGKLKAVAKAKLGFLGVDAKVTVIDQQAWIRATGISRDYDLSGNLGHIFADPLLLLTDIAGAVENPTVTKTETTKQGEQRTWISGTFNPSLIQDGDVRAFVEKIGSKPVDVALDGEGRLVSVRLGGPLVSQDSGDVVRRIDISGFGAPVDISAP